MRHIWLTCVSKYQICGHCASEYIKMLPHPYYLESEGKWKANSPQSRWSTGSREKKILTFNAFSHWMHFLCVCKWYEIISQHLCTGCKYLVAKNDFLVIVFLVNLSEQTHQPITTVCAEQCHFLSQCHNISHNNNNVPHCNTISSNGWQAHYWCPFASVVWQQRS